MAAQNSPGDMKSPYNSSSRESTRNPEAGLMGSEGYPVGHGHGDKADFQDMLRLGKKQEFKVHDASVSVKGIDD